MTTYFLGIDGGGTKCKAVLIDEHNHIIATGLSGSANPYQGLEQAKKSIVTAAEQALIQANLPNIALADITAGIGLAGVNVPSLYQQIMAWQHPFKNMVLATDVFTACLAAHQGEDGAVIIIGTGTCGISHVNNQQAMLGGHGFPFGDVGGGAWFGSEAVKCVLLSFDGLNTPTELTPAICAYLNVDNAMDLVAVIAGKPAAFFAELAGFVFSCAECKDKTATNIIEQGVQYIENMAELLLKNNPPRLALLGGLANRIQPWLSPSLQAKLSPPLMSPEMGCVLLVKNK